MKQYLVAFYRFWYKFLIGSDWTIAVTVLWSLLAIYSLNRFNVSAWYLLPVLVGLLLGWLLKRAEHAFVSNKQIIILAGKRPIYFLWFVMTVVVAGPEVLTAVIYRNTGLVLTHVLLPMVFSFSLIVLAGMAIASVFRRFPVFGSLLAGAAAWLLMQAQYRLFVLAANITQSSFAEGWLVFVGCLCFSAAVVLVVAKRS